MNDARRFGGLEYLLLFLVLTAAAGVRCWYVGVCAQNGSSAGPLQVQDIAPVDRAELVENLSRDGRFAVGGNEAGPPRPIAHPAPLYPYALSALRRLGPDLGTAERWARWIQCGLGAVTAGLLFSFARRAFQSNVVAGVAGLLAVLHPFWIVGSAEVEDGVLATFLLALVLWAGGRANHTRGALTSWTFGLALAGLALTRAALLPFAFLALLWFLQFAARQTRGWLPALLAVLGFVSGLAPWMVRNYVVFHEVYPIVDNSVPQLWTAHHAAAPDTAQSPATDADRLRALGAEIREHPSAKIQGRLWAGLYFLFGEEWFHAQQFALPAANEEVWSGCPDWLTRSFPSIFAGTLLALFSLALLGWRTSYLWRREAMPLSLAFVWIPLPYVIGHAEKLSSPRLPWDAVAICFAAYGLVWLVASTLGFGRQRAFGAEVEH